MLNCHQHNINCNICNITKKTYATYYNIYLHLKYYDILDMTIIGNELNSLSKEWTTEAFPTLSKCQAANPPVIAKTLQQTSEGLMHLSIQWPNYAKDYDTNILEVLKLIQVITQQGETRFPPKIFGKC